MKKLTLPSVLSFNRKLEPSDGIMFSGNWKDHDNRDKWEPIKLFDRRNRAVKSNFTQEVLDDEEELRKQIEEANLSWGDDTSLKLGHDTLRLSFSLRVIDGVHIPSACNAPDFESRLTEFVDRYVKNDLNALADRYALNIANGRFLWRNRVRAEEIKIRVTSKCLDSVLEFNAYDFPLENTTSDNLQVKALSDLIHSGFIGEKTILLQVEAFSQLGDMQRVWPSQEMILNSVRGEKSRHLCSLNGIAGMHCEKIGNALRTIDDWYPEFADTKKPIAIEAYGSVTQKGIAYRSTRNDFRTLLLKWINGDDETLSHEQKHFVVAMFIRGGVFSEAN